MRTKFLHRPAVDISDLHRGDGPLLDELMAGMSDDSRYLRFHAAVGSLTTAMRDALLDVDGDRHLALVARFGDHTVGIARFIRHPKAPCEAEVAVAVADSWHRRGIGRQLLERLTDRAVASGISRLTASVLACNEPALGLVQAVFKDRLVTRHRDVVDVVGLVGAAKSWEITMDDVLAELLH